LLEKNIVASPPETAPVDFGAAVQAEARRRGLGRARYVYLVIVTIYTTKRWLRLAHLLAVGQLSPSGLNSKTDSEVVVGSGSDRASLICCI
jgi:hypothetical protein